MNLFKMFDEIEKFIQKNSEMSSVDKKLLEDLQSNIMNVDLGLRIEHLTICKTKEIVSDLKKLNAFDDMCEYNFDIPEEDYLDFFNNLIDKYELNIDKIKKASEIYEKSVVCEKLNFYMLKDELVRILLNKLV